MNTLQTSFRFLSRLALVACAALAVCAALIVCLAPPGAKAGAVPFTQNQFPVYYQVSATPVSVTNTSEQILVQYSIPPYLVGNAGYMKFNYALDGDGIANAHTVRFYLGGYGTSAPPTSATALFTNTFTTTQGQPMSALMFPYIGGYSNLVYSSLTTNFYGAPKQGQIITVGSQTNGLLLTVTGSNLGTTNYLTLPYLIIEALSQ
jgi:hypothetical protein